MLTINKECVIKNFITRNKNTGNSTSPLDSKLHLLLGLILIDLTVLALHFYNSWIPDEQWNSFLALAVDFSLGEFVQYFKWLFIAVLFVYMAIKQSSLVYLSWALIFTYLLLDDSLSIHENVGSYLMRNANFTIPFGLRIQDIGELLVSAIAGSILLIFSVWAYIKGDTFFKIITHSMLLLFLALVFFGVVIDIVAVMAYTGKISGFIFDVIEDGGEMLVGSLMLWYAVLIINTEGLAITFIGSLDTLYSRFFER